MSQQKSSSSYVATTLENDPLSVPHDHRIQEGQPQTVSNPRTSCMRAAGILRYKRESDNDRINLPTLLPAPSTEYPVQCEYCGGKARPPLNPTCVQEPEKTHFCCVQRQQLYQMLVIMRLLFEGRNDFSNLTSNEEKSTQETEDPAPQGREMEDHNKFIMDLVTGLGIESEPKVAEDYSVILPVAETSASKPNILSFRLSCAPEKGYCTVDPTEKRFALEEEQVLASVCDHRPTRFGMCHHQEGTGFLEKYYSNGMKFLTVFPDGSAQVFYPSGLLALIVVVTEQKGRVCIVYDDSSDPSQQIRAVFQSDGAATCYHSNGFIWLALNRSGGQCLNESGARICRWSWGSVTLTPTPLQPVFLSLNKSVGVRVLGITQVFVSFLAKGQQAKFSVGTCCTQGECKGHEHVSGASLQKEELFVLAAKIRIHMAFQHLHLHLLTQSHPQPPKAALTPHLQVAARKILEASTDVEMSDSDRAFIHRCLQDC
ncbi:glutamate-rich protein 6 isoform X2 [Mugil cephalus]|uniref:glutamate-rich protein 6 isoform X2 n=1 Tax=Mugil cephalus TaxID=48193 RepID=UPI001FB5CA1A|nr:glutamate-rich protein 6 isoform X2 [Mugil cephalus]